MTIKVIQWATGGVGRAAVQYICAHPQLELVGCWVSSADKEGRDAGEICGLESVGVAATRDAWFVPGDEGSDLDDQNNKSR